MKRIILTFTFINFLIINLLAQYPIMDYVYAEVDFSKKLHVWDGFGFNYVETSQTFDYDSDPQDYGGFSILDQADREKVIDMVFGENGLKVGLLKMFYDPFHQEKPDGNFNHERTTQYLRMFARDGYRKTIGRGGNLQIITTLYGPPAWATLQKVIRGRDIDPAQKENLANYLVSWAKFLKEKENLPVKYVSIHNEGEDLWRWPIDGKDPNIGKGHDYNMFWPPQLIAEFLPLLKTQLLKSGLNDVGVTPGETSNWSRFHYWGYAPVIAGDTRALEAMDLITSHGFGDHSSVGIDLLREKKPGLHAWATSTSWGQMDARNIRDMHVIIYTVKANGIIPWAGIQRPPKWVGGDPNPGNAFTVHEDGTLELRRGYYFYKQISRAGQPGMAVAQTYVLRSDLALIAFSSNDTKNNDAFLIINTGRNPQKLRVDIKGVNHKIYAAFRTNETEEQYKDIGSFNVINNILEYEAPVGSVTTFFAR